MGDQQAPTALHWLSAMRRMRDLGGLREPTGRAAYRPERTKRKTTADIARAKQQKAAKLARKKMRHAR